MTSSFSENHNSDLKPLYDPEFHFLSELVYRYSGINLHTGKRELIRSRLCSHLRKLGINSFREYCDYLKSSSDTQEIHTLLNILSTNMTQFFREKSHFDFLYEELPNIIKSKKKQGNNRLRLWSTACSSGEEAYSIAIILAEVLNDMAASIDAKILATDISSAMLERARTAQYHKERMQDVSFMWRTKYFQVQQDYFVANPLLRSFIQFRQLNVVGPWPFQGLFDIIFCRNMMIYFDKMTQHQLVNRLSDVLQIDGYLFLGHSESLVGFAPKLKYIIPSVYRKIA